MKATNGHNVSVHYRGTLNDGTEFDNSRSRGQPINFTLGSGKMIPGFNDAVVGMTVGETKTFSISPESAYGLRNEEAIQTVPRAAFGEDFPFEVGGVVQGNGPQGPFLAKIRELQEQDVVVDFNHPLAGEELQFEVEMMSIGTE